MRALHLRRELAECNQVGIRVAPTVGEVRPEGVGAEQPAQRRSVDARSAPHLQQRLGGCMPSGVGAQRHPGDIEQHPFEQHAERGRIDGGAVAQVQRDRARAVLQFDQRLPGRGIHADALTDLPGA